MPNVSQKLKILHLARIFLEQTDEDHGLSTPRLIEELAAVGVSVGAKGPLPRHRRVTRFRPRHRNQGPPPFPTRSNHAPSPSASSPSIVDAVSSSRFLTEEAEELIDSIGRLGSRHQASRLAGNVHVDRRVTRQSDSVYANVDVLREALRSNCKVEFSYFKTDVRKTGWKSAPGRRYLLTPVAIVYSDDFYYLVTYSDKHDGFANYRVDRMEALRMSDEPATRNEAIAGFEVEAYRSGSFGMFSGKRRNVTLLVHESAMNGVVDRFGDDALVTPGPSAQTDRPCDCEHPDGRRSWARVTAAMTVSPPLFGWLAQFGDRVLVESPSEVEAAYHEHLKSILATSAADMKNDHEGRSRQ